MTAINRSISYQSQFATPNPFLNEMRTKSREQLHMEPIKRENPKPVTPKYLVQNVAPLGELGRHINLKA